jgi:hypothetical protein
VSIISRGSIRLANKEDHKRDIERRGPEILHLPVNRVDFLFQSQDNNKNLNLGIDYDSHQRFERDGSF